MSLFNTSPSSLSAVANPVWGSRWVFVMAATGSAVGLGNIWKFPYIAGQNGGGAFVLMYLFCIVVIGVPIMIAEVMIGRKSALDPVHGMQLLARKANASRFWTLLGAMGVLTGFLILSYYSVVASWVLAYVFESALGTFSDASAEQVNSFFTQDLLSNPLKLVFWHSVFMLMTMIVVARGVNAGIESTIRVLMPVLFLLLAVLLGYSFSSGSFDQGFDFLFSFDTSKLSRDALLIAMGHAFFTLSLGMGSIMVYGAYMPQKLSIGTTVLSIAALDTLVALVAGMVIFPIVFANSLEPGAGPGLLFVTLPVAFGHMPFGSFFATLFFILVSFAAWSSSISLIEPAIAWLERKGYPRKTLALVTGLLVWLLGLGSVFSFNIAADLTLFGKTFFDLVDYLTSNIMLPLGGLGIAIFAGWIMKRTTVQKELAFKSYVIYVAWTISIRFIAPLAVFVVLIWTLFPEQLKALLGS
jgi:neurotransmitter:Na+ symporter, NSS family